MKTKKIDLKYQATYYHTNFRIMIQIYKYNFSQLITGRNIYNEYHKRDCRRNESDPPLAEYQANSQRYLFN